MKTPYLCLAFVAVELLPVGALFADNFEYAYNFRSELTRVSCASNVLFGYEYDNAGNLLWACVGSSTNVYESNSLNQYTRVTASDGSVCTFAYDEEGNLMEDSRFFYEWDSAGRMASAMPSGLNGGLGIKNCYDPCGRRVKKEVYAVMAPNVTPRERLISTTIFIYDGSKPVLERMEMVDGQTYETYYFWGKDLSGCLDGACGVGGLLYVKMGDEIYIPLYEVNGNIYAYCDNSGNIVARRNYSPFGQMISATATSDALFSRLHIWFSTKYLDNETGLYYFGSRFYSPFLCRWLNRDPIEEHGGLNLYAFCGNNPISNYDKDGCAYFAYRPLDNPITKKLGVRWRGLDNKNWVLAHEQLFFEDGGEPVNIGYFDSSTTHRDEFNFQNQYIKLPGKYDDCVMREAVKNVKPKPYSFWKVDASQYNCQTYADDLRREYFRLLADRKIWCRCGLDKKGVK